MQQEPITDLYSELLIQYMPFSFQPLFVPITTEAQWKTSDYGSGEQGKERAFDTQIRKSEYKFVNMESNSVFHINLPLSNSNNQKQWRLIRYQNGKFTQHQDKQVQENHVGTQIIILPKKQSHHTKGELIIYNPKNEKQFIRVQAKEMAYVYVYIPLGYPHEITEVEGVRTVATRMVMRGTNQEQKHPFTSNSSNPDNNPSNTVIERKKVITPGLFD